MKKFLIFLGIIAVVAVALMATTPDRQQHVDTIKSVMTGAVNAELREKNIDGPLGSIASAAATMAVDKYLSTNFLVRDHRFCIVSATLIIITNSKWYLWACLIMYIPSTRSKLVR